MTVHFIGAGPGDPELITVRGARFIKECQTCLYAGSLVPREVISLAPSGARILDTAPMSLDQIEHEFLAAHERGHDVARLHSGDISVWSAVGEQVRRLGRHNIPYTMTPGVPAFAAAASALGVELTMPERAQSLVLTRTSGRATPMPPEETLETFATSRATLAIHLSIHVLEDTMARLLPSYGSDCPVVVVYRASWPDEVIVRGTIGTISARVREHDLARTALILVGRSLGQEGFPDSALYSSHYRRRFRESAACETTEDGSGPG